MCGILGQINSENCIDINNFHEMLETLSIRGPDGLNVKILNNERVALGHARLAIIDLSSNGIQPMCNEDNTLWLTFNGEIYNYQVIKKDLLQKGHIFHSESDSEVIIHAYEEWGEDCLKKLRGLFAFCIFDCKRNSLFLGRDHIGVKPLYYYYDKGSFIFASQPKAILASNNFNKSLDFESLSLYLAYGNVPQEYSIFNGIKKLLPGHSLSFSNNKIVIKNYWTAKYNPRIFNEKEAIDIIKSKIIESVNIQKMSDVPIGTFLSGGIDSTIITSILQECVSDKIDTFTIGFNEKESDEREYANKLVHNLQTNHNEKVLTYEKSIELINDINEAYDEPFHFNGLFPFYYISELSKQKGIKVILGGDGADEIFTGYLRYDNFHSGNQKLRKASFLRNLFSSKSEANESIRDYFKYEGFLNWNQQSTLINNDLLKTVNPNIYEPISRYYNRDNPDFINAEIIDINCYLPDHILTKVDRGSMANGVEVRVPFLDYELIDLVFQIDHNIIYKNNERKYLLKKAMDEYIPNELKTLRKKGFSSPLDNWFNDGLQSWGKHLLFTGALLDDSIFERKALMTSFDFMSSKDKLLFISLELWYKRWIKGIKHFDIQKLIYDSKSAI